MLLAVALAAGLAACDPGDEPPDEPSTDDTSTSAEPTTTDPSSDIPTPPELDAPTPPEAIGVDNREGAAAAVEYFFNLLHYGRATGETSALEAMSDEGCRACSTLIEGIESLHSDGGWVESAPYGVDDFRVAFPTDEQPGYYVQLALDEPPGTQHRGDGTAAEIAGQVYPDVVVVAAFQSDGFSVMGVDLEE